MSNSIFGNRIKNLLEEEEVLTRGEIKLLSGFNNKELIEGLEYLFENKIIESFTDSCAGVKYKLK